MPSALYRVTSTPATTSAAVEPSAPLSRTTSRPTKSSLLDKLRPSADADRDPNVLVVPVASSDGSTTPPPAPSSRDPPTSKLASIIRLRFRRSGPNLSAASANASSGPAPPVPAIPGDSKPSTTQRPKTAPDVGSSPAATLPKRSGTTKRRFLNSMAERRSSLLMSANRNPPGKLDVEEVNKKAPREDEERGRQDLSPNAKSVKVTKADGDYTDGVVNQHPAVLSANCYRVGVSEDRNRKCRRTMEDAHAFVYDFGGVKGQGYFAVFDGHAGKHAAEWCGKHFHEHLLDALKENPSTPIPDLLNHTFHLVDRELSKMAADSNTHSGCTAVTAFLRLEDAEGNPVGQAGGISEEALREKPQAPVENGEKKEEEEEKPAADGAAHSAGDKTDRRKQATEYKAAKRTLYTANVGDARAVLCRGGKAVRLTYDHKGSDAQEAKRITDAGGFVMNNRVNGVLAVTRSLGDSSMKEFVVGSPYTTETTLTSQDEFLIIACDGLWDVCEDQKAVDIVREVGARDPQDASQKLLDHALQNFSTDNLSVLVISF